MPVCTAKPPSSVVSLSTLQLNRPAQSDLRYESEVHELITRLNRNTFNSTLRQVYSWLKRSSFEDTLTSWIKVVEWILSKVLCDGGSSGICARLCSGILSPRDKNTDDGFPGPGNAGLEVLRKYLLDKFRHQAQRRCPVARPSSAQRHLLIPSTRGQGSALINFIGELLKHGVMSEDEFHSFLDLLLGDVEYPGEDRLESICTLLYTTGRILDASDVVRPKMDEYFVKLEEYKTKKGVRDPTRRMIGDLIQLRHQQWANPKPTASETGSVRTTGKGATPLAILGRGPRPPVDGHSPRKAGEIVMPQVKSSGSRSSSHLPEDARHQPESRSALNHIPFAIFSRVGDAAPQT